MAKFNMKVDSDILVLGSSSIPEEDYLQLASDLGDGLAPLYATVWSRALNPADTSAFVKSIANQPNKDQLIYRRAICCIDNARFIVVDISQASTGMGLEVGYLLSKLKEQNKYVCFIAKEGSKISPHITGMYKHVTGEDCAVVMYDEAKNMFEAVRTSIPYENYRNMLSLEGTY